MYRKPKLESISKAATSLGIGSKTLFSMLENNGILYRDRDNKCIASSQQVRLGRFINSEREISKGTHTFTVREVKVTENGKAFLRGFINDHEEAKKQELSS